MKREFQRLGEGPFDLLVVGGGIYGAWSAYDAALRGVRVALVEACDWGAGTSSASSKLIHGGLRYLERGHLGVVRTALAEREGLLALAPHRVRRLRFALPVREGARVGGLRARAGLWLYDLLGNGRNDGRHEALSARGMLERYPFLDGTALRGGFTYGDAVTDDARLVLEIVAGAIDAGAIAVNHASAELSCENGRVVGARITDRETSAALDVRAAVTFNAAGPWIDRLAGFATPLARLSKGIHLVLPALAASDAMLLPSDDGRVVFLVPWYGRTLLGTTDDDFTGEPGTERVAPAEVEFLLEQASRYLAPASWTRDDVIASFAGLRALPRVAGRETFEITREWSLDASRPGLLTSVGGKLSSARADAERAVDAVRSRLGLGRQASATRSRALPWAPSARWDRWLASAIARGIRVGLDANTAEACACRHGSRIGQLLDLCEREPAFAAAIVPGLPFCRAEIVFAARHEMARDLSDVLRRRIPLVLLAHLEEAVLRDAANLAGDELGWTPERRAAEVSALAGAFGRPAAGVAAG